MKMIQEFRAFAIRGNMVDMAVGIVIGVAFGRVVSSFVNDIVMPPLGVLVSGVHFSELSLTLRKATGDEPDVTLNYGAFVQAAVDFLIVAAAIFLVIRAINRLRRRAEEEPAEPEAPAPTREEALLAEIRDLLRAGR